MKVYVVISKWNNEEDHDYEIVCTTTDKAKAVEAMNQDFNDRLEDENINDNSEDYEIVRCENSCEYWDRYGYDEYSVTIHERELD